MRRYLAEFLADARVVPLPRWLWLPILHGIVLRTRPEKSAEKYAAIWTEQGSPLAVHTRRQTESLRSVLPNLKIEYAMRYGEPAIASALERLRGCDVTVLPLYPQYSASATESVADKLPPGMRVIREFHAHPAYIAALAASVRRHWRERGRGAPLLMSFHGLPKRGGEAYQEQCIATATLLAAKLELDRKDWRATFQSRFGYAEWLRPYTEATLIEMARKGNAEVDVMCPGFVSDCLETLEEIGITAKKKFLDAGGRELRFIPCLNEAPEWIEALVGIVSGRRAP